MNTNIKYLIFNKIKGAKQSILSKDQIEGKALNAAQDQGQDSAKFRFVDLFEAVPRILFTF